MRKECSKNNHPTPKAKLIIKIKVNFKCTIVNKEKLT